MLTNEEVTAHQTLIELRAQIEELCKSKNVAICATLFAAPCIAENFVNFDTDFSLVSVNRESGQVIRVPDEEAEARPEHAATTGLMVHMLAQIVMAQSYELISLDEWLGGDLMQRIESAGMFQQIKPN